MDDFLRKLQRIRRAAAKAKQQLDDHVLERIVAVTPEAKLDVLEQAIGRGDYEIYREGSTQVVETIGKTYRFPVEYQPPTDQAQTN